MRLLAFLKGSIKSVCKLQNALYGLKQSLRAWFEKFSNSVLDFFLHRCQADHSIFYLHTNSGNIFLLVYVDGIVITDEDYRYC